MKSEFEIWRDELDGERKPRAARSGLPLVLIGLGAVMLFLWIDGITREVQITTIENVVSAH